MSTFRLIKSGSISFFLFLGIILVLLFPLNNILPEAAHGLIPPYLYNKSLLIYLSDHANAVFAFIAVIFTFIMLFVLINTYKRK